jgi:hypothetical protein
MAHIERPWLARGTLAVLRESVGDGHPEFPGDQRVRGVRAVGLTVGNGGQAGKYTEARRKLETPDRVHGRLYLPSRVVHRGCAWPLVAGLTRPVGGLVLVTVLLLPR